MKLLELYIENFKKTRKFALVLHGSNAVIYGDNATGKTTIADAYFWLLFGKDSAGRSDFDLLPMDSAGRIIEGLEASVSGKFVGDDGKEFSLRRAYHQVFTRKNGEAERKLKGNTTEFFINDVPKPQKDYQAFVAGICDEKTFAMLTDPDMFPGKMAWGDRRDMLIHFFAPDVDDREIINAHKELQPLGNYLGYKTVDEYTEWAKAQRRKINDQLKEIPGRIDEAEKAKPDDLPLVSDGADMIRLGKQKLKLETDLNNLRNGSSASDAQRTIAEIRAQMATAKASYIERTSAGNAGLEASAAQLRGRIADSERTRSYLSSSITTKANTMKNISAEMDRLRQCCVDTAAKEFPASDNICPTCGQEYPLDKQEQIHGDFNEHKAEALKELEQTGRQRKVELENLKKQSAEDQAKLQQEEQTLKELRTQLDNLTKQFVTPPPFEDTEEAKKLQDKLTSAENELKVLQTVADKKSATLQEQLSLVTADIDAIKARALNKDAVARQDERISELKKQESDLSKQLAEMDTGLTLAEKFTMQKAQDIEAKVNGAFRIVRWKLFDTQVNGGIKPCCEATVDGIPYGKDLNSAARMNAGLDIIEALSGQVGMCVPIWIDNAESVTKYLPVNAQVIRLFVSEGDKKLRVEVEGC